MRTLRFQVVQVRSTYHDTSIKVISCKQRSCKRELGRKMLKIALIFGTLCFGAIYGQRCFQEGECLESPIIASEEIVQGFKNVVFVNTKQTTNLFRT